MAKLLFALQMSTVVVVGEVVVVDMAEVAAAEGTLQGEEAVAEVDLAGRATGLAQAAVTTALPASTQCHKTA